MKKIFFVITLIALLCALAESCKHSPPELIAPDVGTGTGTGTGTGIGSTLVCFENEVLPIFLSNCAKSNCHDAASANGNYIFNNYQNIIRKDVIAGNATNSKVYKVLFETGNDKMPQPPNPDLSAAQKALIGRWINEGARNSTNCGSNCDTTQFRFAANINVILTSNCIGCHGGNAPLGNLNLSNYASVFAIANSGRLYGAVTHSIGYSPMPKDAAKLNDCQITQIRKWIQARALNN